MVQQRDKIGHDDRQLGISTGETAFGLAPRVTEGTMAGDAQAGPIAACCQVSVLPVSALTNTKVRPSGTLGALCS